MTTTRFDGAAIPGAIVSGLGCRKRIAPELDRLGLERVLIVCSPTLRRTTGVVAELETLLGARLAGVYDGIRPNSPESTVRAAAEFARGLSPDAVLSVGGGAVHDTAKGIAVMVPSDRSIAEFVSRFEPPSTFRAAEVDVVPLPVLTMPSTFSAADVVGGGAVTDEKTGGKLIFVHPKLTPVCVFLDGEVVATTPLPILAASGMNAVHHCLEALYSKGHQPLTDAFGLEALRGLVETLPHLSPPEGRLDPTILQAALEAASMSGLTYANSWLGIGHAVCHSLGGRYGVSHGAANAVMVRHSIRFNLADASDRLAIAVRATGACFSPAQQHLAARHMIAVVDWLSECLRTPRTLREIGLPAGQFEHIAKDVMADPQTYWNPRPVTAEDVFELLQAAW